MIENKGLRHKGLVSACEPGYYCRCQLKTQGILMPSSNKPWLVAAGALIWLSTLAAAEITDKARKQGMDAAPALLMAAGIPCTVTEAYKMPTKPTQADTFEVSCQEGLGYVITPGPAKQPPRFYLCIEAIDAAPSAERTLVHCALAGNLSDAQRPAILALLAKTNLNCDLDRWRGIGHTSVSTVIEVACKDGNDVLLMAPHPLVFNATVQAIPCLSRPEGNSISCTLTDRATQLAAVDALFAKDSSRSCEISDRRYMATTTTGDNYYELLCKNGTGYVMQKTANGALGSTTECSAKLAADLGGCKLGKSGP
jgi:hypothetical protein